MALRDQDPVYPSLLTRSELVRLLKAALEVNADKFARQSAVTWLAAYPGDLEVSRLFALALNEDGKTEQARAVLEKVIQIDPEDRESYRILAELKSSANEEAIIRWWGAYFTLSGEIPASANVKIPEWSEPARESLLKLAQKQYQEAEELIHQSLVIDSGLPLMDLLHLKINCVEQDTLAVRQLAGMYHERWPDCLAFQYVNAEKLMESGDEFNGSFIAS